MSQGVNVSNIADKAWPNEGLEQLGHCPVCQAEQREMLFDNLFDNTFDCAPGRWTLWRCRACRSAYLDPRPTPETIKQAYESYYTHASAGQADQAQTSLIRRIRQRLLNGYSNVRYGTRLTPAYPLLGRLYGALFPRRRKACDSNFRFLPKGEPGRTLLDVGSGSGDFLALAATAGWQAMGVDFDPVAVEQARSHGFEVREGGIDAAEGMHAHFDAITMSHVIEHVHDPAHVLQTAFDLLKPGGTLFLETPNAESLGLELYGPSWRGLEAPRHLTLFTGPSMQALLERIGFAAVQPIYRREVSKSIFRISKEIAIKSGGNPPASTRLNWRERLFCYLPLLNPRRNEFITVMARKPGA